MPTPLDTQAIGLPKSRADSSQQCEEGQQSKEGQQSEKGQQSEESQQSEEGRLVIASQGGRGSVSFSGAREEPSEEIVPLRDEKWPEAKKLDVSEPRVESRLISRYHVVWHIKTLIMYCNHPGSMKLTFDIGLLGATQSQADAPEG